MADSLGTLLEPGEREVFRARAVHWRLYLLAILYAMGGLGLTVFLIPAWDSSIDPPSRLVLVVPAMLGLGVSFWLASFIRRNALLVTDRRVIHRSGWWPRPVTMIALDRINELLWWPNDQLDIQGADGATIIAEVFQRPEELARAVARAAGVAAPDFPGRKERVFQGFVTLVHLLAVVLAFVGTVVLFVAIDSVGAVPLGVPLYMLAVVCWLATYLVFSFLGFMVLVAGARFFMTADEMRDDFCRNADVNPLNRLCVALLLRFAGVLYGRPLRCRDCVEGAEARHG